MALRRHRAAQPWLSPCAALPGSHPLSPQPVFLLLGGMGFVTPIWAWLPFQAVYLLLILRTTRERCTAECGGLAAGAAAVCSVPVAGQSGGACAATSDAAARYYSAGIAWVRRAVPMARLLPPAWRCGTGGCRAACYGVHSWLQVGVPVMADAG